VSAQLTEVNLRLLPGLDAEIDELLAIRAEMVQELRDAVVCSPACRAERSRLKRLLAGETVEGYVSVEERLDARRRRTGAAATRTRGS
jgi:hypothetical protein